MAEITSVTNLTEKFKSLDVEGSGKIDRDQLKTFLSSCSFQSQNCEALDEIVDKIMLQVGKDATGAVPIYELINFLSTKLREQSNNKVHSEDNYKSCFENIMDGLQWFAEDLYLLLDGENSKRYQGTVFNEIHTITGFIFSWLLFLNVIIAVITYLISSLPSQSYQPSSCVNPVCNNDPNLCPGVEVCEPMTSALYNRIDFVVTTIFTIEFSLRLLTVWAVDSRTANLVSMSWKMENSEFVTPPKYSTWEQYARFFLSFRSLVDMAIIIPFYVALALQQNLSNVQFLRIFRVFRAFRVFSLLNKYKRFEHASSTLVLTMYNSILALIVLAFCSLIFMIFFGSIMFVIESGTFEVTPDYPQGVYLVNQYAVGAIPALFTSIPTSMYYVSTTLTTVGYGDIFPNSIIGLFVAMLIMLCGTIFVSLPISVVAAEFKALFKKFQNINEVNLEAREITNDPDTTEDNLTERKIAIQEAFDSVNHISDLTPDERIEQQKLFLQIWFPKSQDNLDHPQNSVSELNHKTPTKQSSRSTAGTQSNHDLENRAFVATRYKAPPKQFHDDNKNDTLADFYVGGKSGTFEGSANSLAGTSSTFPVNIENSTTIIRPNNAFNIDYEDISRLEIRDRFLTKKLRHSLKTFRTSQRIPSKSRHNSDPQARIQHLAVRRHDSKVFGNATELLSPSVLSRTIQLGPSEHEPQIEIAKEIVSELHSLEKRKGNINSIHSSSSYSALLFGSATQAGNGIFNCSSPFPSDQSEISIFERLYGIINCEIGNDGSIFWRILNVIGAIVMYSSIFLGVGSYIIATYPTMQYNPSSCSNPACSNDPNLCPGNVICEPVPFEVFSVIENICIIIFSVDYFVRLLLCWSAGPEKNFVSKYTWESNGAKYLPGESFKKNPEFSKIEFYIRYVISLRSLIDLACVVPAYAIYFGSATGSATWVKIFRVLRIFKLISTNRTLREMVAMISQATAKSSDALIMLFLTIIIGTVFFGTIMYTLEKGNFSVNKRNPSGYYYVPTVNTVSTQQSLWESIIVGIYFSATTLTSVGYGDVVPTTLAGRIFTVFIQFTGTVMLSLPVGVMGINFLAEYTNFKNKVNADGIIQKFNFLGQSTHGDSDNSKL